MYVRDAKNREEVWLLDWIEEFDLDDAAFRSRDYVVAVDEETGDKAGFGRIRIHTDGDEKCCELTGIGVLPQWREQGVGAHVVERLVQHAQDERFDRVYAVTGHPRYLSQFGFRRIDAADLPEPLEPRGEADAADPTPIPQVLDVDRFRMPDRLRERFKSAAPQSAGEPEDAVEGPEDFGIDPESATYKYDV